MTAGIARAIGLAALLACGGLAACSSSTSGLTTGTLSSLVPGTKPKETDPAVDRAFQVAATSARATKCGYNFEPGKLRTAYLAFESTQEGGSEKLARLEKSYDFTAVEVGKKIGSPEDFCTEDQTAKIKADLTRHLAGDFSPAKQAAHGSAVDWWVSKSDKKEWNKEETFCPRGTCY